MKVAVGVVVAVLVAAVTGAVATLEGGDPQAGDRLTATAYHERVRSEVPAYAARSDADLDALAVAACDVLRAGRWEDVFNEQAADLDAEATMVELMVRRGCAELLDRIPGA